MQESNCHFYIDAHTGWRGAFACTASLLLCCLQAESICRRLSPWVQLIFSSNAAKFHHILLLRLKAQIIEAEQIQVAISSLVLHLIAGSYEKMHLEHHLHNLEAI